jgi:hypothetical protein
MRIFDLFFHTILDGNLKNRITVRQAVHFVFLIIANVFSSTKLEIRAEQVLPGSEVGRGERKGTGGKGEEWLK